MTAYARSAIYKLLSLAISYPDEEIAHLLHSGILFEELKNYVEKLPKSPLIQQVKNLKPISTEELQTEYTASFDVGIPSPPCSLYEQSYLSYKQELLSNLQSTYASEGLQADLSQEGYDHLAVELEFMHILSNQEAKGKEVREKQREFLERHMASWLPLMIEQAKLKLNSSFYAGLLDLIFSFVSYDLQFLKK